MCVCYIYRENTLWAFTHRLIFATVNFCGQIPTTGKYPLQHALLPAHQKNKENQLFWGKNPDFL
jgi:hypothetical protein